MLWSRRKMGCPISFSVIIYILRTQQVSVLWHVLFIPVEKKKEGTIQQQHLLQWFSFGKKWQKFSRHFYWTSCLVRQTHMAYNKESFCLFELRCRGLTTQSTIVKSCRAVCSVREKKWQYNIKRSIKPLLEVLRPSCITHFVKVQ